MSIRQKRLVTVLFFLLVTKDLIAQDSWNEPFEKWSRKQVSQILNDSPWAGSQTFRIAPASLTHGEREIFKKYTARFFSARPVREAYVRMMQILNKYDEMSPEKRIDFDSRFNRALNLDVSERVIVAVEFNSNDPDANHQMKMFFETARTDTIKQAAYLISQHQNRVELREYLPPGPDGTGAKFVFPRTVNGKQVIEPGDREVRLEFYIGGEKLFISFKVPRMVYKGDLSY
jgi:hypothetical protein